MLKKVRSLLTLTLAGVEAAMNRLTVRQIQFGSLNLSNLDAGGFIGDGCLSAAVCGGLAR